MALELNALLTPNLFCLPNDPGDAAVYVCPMLARQPQHSVHLHRAGNHQHAIHTQKALLLVNEEHREGMHHRPRRQRQ